VNLIFKYYLLFFVIYLLIKIVWYRFCIVFVSFNNSKQAHSNEKVFF
jgi:hypothetical protein